jgi:signal peptidase I
MLLNPRWFFSRTVRIANDMCKHVLKILNAQRDLLSPQAIEAVEKALGTVRDAIRAGEDNKKLQERMNHLENVANKWLKAYPHASIRDNVEVFLVAMAVAMSIRTFFLQPFKIPTGSMQPTLYGITHENSPNDPGVPFSTGLAKFADSWLRGISYYQVKAETEGTLQIIDYVPKRVLPLINKQRFVVGDTPYTIWFPPDNLFGRAGLHEGQKFEKGEDVIKMKVLTGDHLFVDRMTYNFRRPKRGEIIVFETKGIETLPQDQFYIKRLVALGGERVRIGNDRHLIIDGKRLDATTPHFERVYSFQGPPRQSQYSGHVNDDTGPGLARLLRHETTEFNVSPNHYLVMGDNTMNSSDSRTWGDFPRTNVIGKSFFVYWPFTERFGWANR